jgi:hypothetical protein
MISVERSALVLFTCAALPASAGCGSTEGGTRLYVGIEHHFAGSSPVLHAEDAPRQFTTDLGHEVTLEQGYVTLSAVELFACEDGHASFWQELRRSLTLIPEAHAHSEPSSDLELTVPVVDDLLRADGEAHVFGQLSPPAGEYCRVQLTFGAADSDAEELPATPDMVGVTLHLSGTVLSGVAAPQPFTYRSSGGLIRSMDLVDASGASAPLVLDGGHPEADLVVGLVYDTWLDGLALDSATASSIAADALDQVEATCHHTLAQD